MEVSLAIRVLFNEKNTVGNSFLHKQKAKIQWCFPLCEKYIRSQN